MFTVRLCDTQAIIIVIANIVIIFLIDVNANGWYCRYGCIGVVCVVCNWCCLREFSCGDHFAGIGFDSRFSSTTDSADDVDLFRIFFSLYLIQCATIIYTCILGRATQRIFQIRWRSCIILCGLWCVCVSGRDFVRGFAKWISAINHTCDSFTFCEFICIWFVEFGLDARCSLSLQLYLRKIKK